ncbi:hypothetical protein K491DRAFT_773726 [Lophiostoma macrostomum CBS 122681]|uniref:Uncharacterized protein n=1 Tax=Lophiostoma macrostomum CBS 122681 TaxID=1314788 RepID=A0A6A6TS32_9PLEO|nr:hypothetical protein K491DRAFT_773726 [Lophiostoma macrostomum CBS 122681]
MTSFSPFLAIPGEIRNHIYKFALTSPNGLYCNRTIDVQSRKPVLYILENEASPDTAASKHDISNVLEYNQLKYVNKLLYKEAAGLELQYNVVTFLRNNDVEPNPIGQFLDFARACNPAKLEWPMRIVLSTAGHIPPPKEGTKPWYQDCRELIKLCSVYPNITVSKLIRLFSIGADPYAIPDTSRQLVSGVLYDSILRDRPFPHQYMPVDTIADWQNQTQMLVDMWGGQQFIDEGKLDNISFLPEDWQKGFDRDAFLDPSKWSSRMRAFMDTPHKREFWADTVERWYTEGI